MQLLLALLAGCDTGPDYGAYTKLISADEARLVTTPCDAEVVARLASSYASAGESALAVAVYTRTRAAGCDWDRQIAYEGFRLAKEVGDWQSATSMLDELIDANPSESGPLVDRATAHEHVGNWTAAADDLRRAWLLNPRGAEAGMRFAKAQTQTARPCDAWDTYGVLHWYNPSRRGELQILRSKLGDAHGCRRLRTTGEYKAAATETPGGLFTFPVLVGTTPLALGADSSAAYSLLTETAAAKAGIVAAGVPIIVDNAYGTSSGRLARIPLLQLGSMEVVEIEVIVVEKLAEGVDGLLGVNFLTRAVPRRDGRHYRFSPTEI